MITSLCVMLAAISNIANIVHRFPLRIAEW